MRGAPEILPETLIPLRREVIEPDAHDMCLRWATTYVLRFFRVDTLSMTYRYLEELNRCNDPREAMEKLQPLEWIDEDGGTNCFGLAVRVQEILQSHYNIPSLIVPFEADSHLWPQDASVFLLAGHGAVLIPSQIGEEPLEHMIDLGFGIPEPLHVDNPSSKVFVDGRIFWVTSGRDGQPSALYVEQPPREQGGPSRIVARRYKIDNWGRDQAQEAMRCMCPLRKKLVITKQGPEGEEASLRVRIDQQTIAWRERGVEAWSYPLEILRETGDHIPLAQCASHLGMDPEKLTHMLQYVAGNREVYLSAQKELLCPPRP